MDDFSVRPGQCALLIYDTTRELVDPSSPGYEREVADGMPLLRQLIDVCHRREVPVFYALPQSALDKHGAEAAADAVCDEIKPKTQDTVIVRKKSGALAESPREGLLRQPGRTTILIAGMAVDRGCNTAARDAQNLGLKPVMVEDVCFTRDISGGRFGFISREEIRKIHLASLERAFAKIVSVKELTELLSR